VEEPTGDGKRGDGKADVSFLAKATEGIQISLQTVFRSPYKRMYRSPYKRMYRSPYKKESRSPYKKCLELLTDK
jgi:hypothetical protein